MRKLTSVLLSVAVLGAAHQVEGSDSDKKGSAAPADCFAEFNAARERAGLEAFAEEKEEGKKLPTGENDIAAICSAIQEGTVFNITEADTQRKGTYAYAPETDPADGCSAAVSYWKGAHVNFGELPPEYKGDTDVYAESRNRSLVALYNPQNGATVDCAYITCPISTTSTTAAPTTSNVTTATTDQPTTPSTAGGPALFSDESKGVGSASLDVQGQASAPVPTSSPVSHLEGSEDPERTGPSVRRLSAPSETVTGLVCLTNPEALVKGEKPFSEDVWANIKKAIENSASASTHSALLAIALLLVTSFTIL